MQYSYDPYDLWAMDSGINIRRLFYAGSPSGKAGAALVAAADWLCPTLSRELSRVNKSIHPITAAHLILLDKIKNSNSPHSKPLSDPLDVLANLAAWKGDTNGWGWGLGFPWMSKNGLYSSEIPFITHTPYVMEALLALAEKESLKNKATEMFQGTWGLLESLHVMYRDSDALALSYAPVDEPRIVVNANAYAAFAYALHAVHGREDDETVATEKAALLANWVVRMQHGDGYWNYYADNLPGNFIDCFHSCFVVKNLLKTVHLLPGTASFLMPSIDKGVKFIRERFPDHKKGLCRRFLERDIKDPYRWDLYDQAEFLGLLIDFGYTDEALTIRNRTKELFSKGSTWWCRIDCFGRRWGKDFLRWGIVPFWYQSARLDRAMNSVNGEPT